LSRPKDVAPDSGNLEEELGLDNEIDLGFGVLQDRYLPHKPRYFNRVKTGYDWNKYNQTHYDHDNPPPKIVQGYKFNIFYPDLFDKNTSPKYYTFLEAIDSTDFCIICYSCGLSIVSGTNQGREDSGVHLREVFFLYISILQPIGTEGKRAAFSHFNS